MYGFFLPEEAVLTLFVFFETTALTFLKAALGAALPSLTSAVGAVPREWTFRVTNLTEVLAPADFTRRITGQSMEDAYNAIVRRQWTRFLVPMLRLFQWGIRSQRKTLVRLVADLGGVARALGCGAEPIQADVLRSFLDRFAHHGLGFMRSFPLWDRRAGTARGGPRAGTAPASATTPRRVQTALP